MQVHDPSIAGVIIILNEISIVDYYEPRANWHVHPVCIKTCRATIVYHYFSICIYILYLIVRVAISTLVSLPVVQARVRKDKGFVVGQFWSLGSMGSDAGYPGWFVFRVSAMDMYGRMI